MSAAAKLQIKPGHSIFVDRKPDRVTLGLGPDFPEASDPAAADAVLVFCERRSDLETVREPVLAAARRDALTWIAYPKAGQLGTDLNRDSLAALLRECGVRPVRQVALDDVWSALRFRPGT